MVVFAVESYSRNFPLLIVTSAVFKHGSSEYLLKYLSKIFAYYLPYLGNDCDDLKILSHFLIVKK